MAVHPLSNDDLRFEVNGEGIATITITRAAKGNSISAGMSPSLKQIWGEVRDNQTIRVAIITAEGERHFCTGAEVGGRIGAMIRLSSRTLLSAISITSKGWLGTGPSPGGQSAMSGSGREYSEALNGTWQATSARSPRRRARRLLMRTIARA